MKTIKIICINSFYYNITKPYYHFKQGEIYEAQINYIDREYARDHLTNQEKIIYSFTFCDLVFGSQNMKNFKTIKEWRDWQLGKLNI